MMNPETIKSVRMYYCIHQPSSFDLELYSQVTDLRYSVCGVFIRWVNKYWQVRQFAGRENDSDITVSIEVA